MLHAFLSHCSRFSIVWSRLLMYSTWISWLPHRTCHVGMKHQFAHMLTFASGMWFESWLADVVCIAASCLVNMCLNSNLNVMLYLIRWCSLMLHFVYKHSMYRLWCSLMLHFVYRHSICRFAYEWLFPWIYWHPVHQPLKFTYVGFAQSQSYPRPVQRCLLGCVRSSLQNRLRRLSLMCRLAGTLSWPARTGSRWCTSQTRNDVS